MLYKIKYLYVLLPLILIVGCIATKQKNSNKYSVNHRWYTEWHLNNEKSEIDLLITIFKSQDTGLIMYYVNGCLYDYTGATNNIAHRCQGATTGVARLNAVDDVPVGRVLDILDFINSYNQEYVLLFDRLECVNSTLLREESKGTEDKCTKIQADKNGTSLPANPLPATISITPEK